MNEEILKKVTDVIVDKLCVTAEDVKLESTFTNDLGADSLEMADLVAALEEEFDIELMDSDTEKFVTVGDVVKFLEEKKKA